MQWGVLAYLTDLSIQPTELAHALDQRGFDAIFVTEHTHIPTARTTPFIGGGELPEAYRRMLDPFVTLTVIGATSSRLRLGTGVSLAAQHDPIVQAKVVSTLDLVSGGRVLFGVGAGWNEEEVAGHGVDPKDRFKVLREKVLAMRTIWTTDDSEFHGRFVDFDPLWSFPKPVQKPHPPILIGGMGPRVVERVFEYGDGWCPAGGQFAPDLDRRIEAFHEREQREGVTKQIWVFNAPSTVGELTDIVAWGVTGAVFEMPSMPTAASLTWLDRVTELRDEVQAGV